MEDALIDNGAIRRFAGIDLAKTRVLYKGIGGKILLPWLSAVGSLMGRGKRGKRRPCCDLLSGCPALGWG